VPAEILLVEDRGSLRAMLAETLEREGYSVEAVAAGDEAVRRLNEGRRYALVLTDLKLPGQDGLAVLKAAIAADPGLPVVVLTGFGTVETAVTAMKAGAADFLSKPVDPDLLLLLIRRHVAARREAVARALLAADAGLAGMPAIVGTSPALAEALERIRRAAESDVTVVLTGESGTGKELFARALHALSARASGPFVPVNVAALPEGLVENELFGHERGAYTGAVERRAGRFEIADGGTLFLDEISELPAAAQSKFLRVVEEKQFLRVGGTVPISVDVRIVVATNRDLGALVRAGSFREDLFYRLEVFPVRLPPLRARKEDIPALARSFADSAAKQVRRKTPLFSAGALERLCEHDWPGNVRELRNVVERSVILTRGDTLRAADVVVGVPGENVAPHPSLDGPLDQVIERWRRAGEVGRIRQALEASGGDRSRAAEELGVPVRRLAQRIRELGI
jgi:DNA-binding NtrC family response regulator